jgi:hypothetical protein
MHLSWNEIKVRAARFAEEWKDGHYERGESQTFYNEFFEVFGVPRRKVATFEEQVKLLGNKRGFVDLFWKGVLLVEQKSAGQNLVRAKQQALDYFPGLKDYELPRYVLVSDFQTLRSMPAVMERIATVRTMRSESHSKPTQLLAETPTRFHVTVIPEQHFLVIPKVSSEKRQYVPIGWLGPPTIPSDLVFVLEGADLWQFGILTSTVHMAWLRQIGGRLESRYRYSIGIVYNNFPWPDATDEQRAKIRTLAQAILDARAQFPNSTLADLYDVDVMPRGLRKAHRDLDTAVDKLYRSTPFIGDRDRVEHLFGLYEKLIAPLSVTVPRAKRARAKRIKP